MSKIVVLGANGFIGRHLVARLAREADNTVVAFGRFSAYSVGGEQPFEDLLNVTVIAGNFFNRDELSSAIDGADYVFHLVSTTNPATSSNDPLIDIETNVKGSIELFELCHEQKIKKVIFFSSGGTVYGDVDSDKINELNLPSPRSPYGIGKLTIEHYLRYFKHRTGMDYIIYRIANPYGPGQNIHGKQGVIPVFLYHYLTRQSLTVFGDGTMVRDYLYVEDLAEMVASTYKKINKYSEYNIGSGRGKNINELIELIESCTGFTLPKKHVDTPTTYVNKSVLDCSRFTTEFGAPRLISLKEGIKRTWEYVKYIEE